MELLYLTQTLNELVNNSNLIPCLIGPHDTSKTSFVKDWAKKQNKSLIILNLAAIKSEDIIGTPYIKGGITYWSKPNIFNYDILFLDELNRVINPSIKSALQTLFTDRTINNYKYEGVVITAGNTTNEYELLEFDPALQDHLIQIEFKPDLDYYIKNKEFKTFVEKHNLLQKFSLRRLLEAEKFLNNLDILKLILDPIAAYTWENYREELSLSELAERENLSEVSKASMIKQIASHRGKLTKSIISFLANLSAEIWSLIIKEAKTTNNVELIKNLEEVINTNQFPKNKRKTILKTLKNKLN